MASASIGGHDVSNIAFEQERQTRFGRRNGAPLSEDERQRWESWCRELMQERDALRLELEQTKSDRERHLRAVYALLPKREYQFTEDELMAAVAGQPSMLETLKELEEAR
jgi:1,6-anhydro-N-acetylmuramate kinase